MEKVGQINREMIPGKIIYSSEKEVEAQIEQIKVKCEQLMRSPYSSWNKAAKEYFDGLVCEMKIAQPVYDRVDEDEQEWWQKD